MTTLTEGERLTRLETEMNHVATKADVAVVRTDLEVVRTDVQAVRADMAKVQTSLVKWMIGLAIEVILSVGLGITDLLITVLAS